MVRNSERGRIISLGSALLFFVAALSVWVVVNTSGTWSYFSNTLQELATITTGFWDDLPGQSGTSIQASKTAEGYWNYVDLEHKIGVRGQVCVSNGGEQPTENLAISDIVQIKFKGTKYEDYHEVGLDLSSYPPLAPGESYCYPYDFEVLPAKDAKYRNVAYVTITNHSGWIPGGHNCPGPELCPFGPAPKSGFDFPPPPDIDSDNISTKTEYLPETGSPVDGDPEGKLIELPAPSVPSPPGESTQPTPTSAASEPPSDENPPAPTEENIIPTPTPAPTMDAYSIPIPAPTAYSGPPGCTRPLKYWINHPGKWQLEHFFLGNAEYDGQQALEILAANPQGDASYILAQQYITALLNTTSPADSSAILEDLKQAALWFQHNPLGSQPGNPERKAGIQIADALEEYNLGESGPGSCTADQPLANPTEVFTPTSTSQLTPTHAPTMAPTTDPTPDPTPTPATTQSLPTPAGTP